MRSQKYKKKFLLHVWYHQVKHWSAECNQLKLRLLLGKSVTTLGTAKKNYSIITTKFKQLEQECYGPCSSSFKQNLLEIQN